MPVVDFHRIFPTHALALFPLSLLTHKIVGQPPALSRSILTLSDRHRNQRLKKRANPLRELFRSAWPSPRRVNVENRKVEVKGQKVYLHKRKKEKQGVARLRFSSQ